MAYGGVVMWEMLIVLERVGRGESRSAVERVMGRTRMTIGWYVVTARSLGWSPGEPVRERLAAEVYRRHRSWGGRGPGDSGVVLVAHQEFIRRWLQLGVNEERGLRLTEVYRKL